MKDEILKTKNQRNKSYFKLKMGVNKKIPWKTEPTLQSIEPSSKKPTYSEQQISELQRSVNAVETDLKFRNEIIKVYSLFKSYRCRTIKDVEDYKLDYRTVNPFACLPYYYFYHSFLDNEGILCTTNENITNITFDRIITNRNICALPLPKHHTEDTEVLVDILPDKSNSDFINLIRQRVLPESINITDKEVLYNYIHKTIEKHNSTLSKEGLDLLNTITSTEEGLEAYYNHCIDKISTERDALSKELGRLIIIQQEVYKVLKTKQKEVDELKAELEMQTPSLLQSPTHIYLGTKGLEKKEQLAKLVSSHTDFAFIKLLFKSIAPNVYHELEKAIGVETKKNAIELYIKQNSEEIISYIVGAKLGKIEDIIFSAFRALAIKAFQLGQVDSPDRKVTVKTSDLFKLCNLKPRKDGGYNTNQKIKIKESLRQENNLLKLMFYEFGKSFIVTSFIKYFHWNNDNTITYEIDSMFFVNEKDKLSYFYEDIEGRNRLISKMPNSEAAYKLHKYLSYALKSSIQEFNVTLLLEQSGLIESYNSKHPNRALNDLQKILNTMYEVNTIIKDKPIKISSGSDSKGKYKLANSRHKEIKAIEQEKKKSKQPKMELVIDNITN